jgi:hypothetical protein
VFVVEVGPGDEWFVRGVDSSTGESLWISAPLLIGPFRLLGVPVWDKQSPAFMETVMGWLSAHLGLGQTER